MAIGLGAAWVCERGGCSRGLCEMVVCHPSKSWFCCLGLLFRGVCGKVCWREEWHLGGVCSASGRSWSHCVSICSHERMSARVTPSKGGTLLADTSVSYPEVPLAASALCTTVAIRYCELKSWQILLLPRLCMLPCVKKHLTQAQPWFLFPDCTSRKKIDFSFCSEMSSSNQECGGSPEDGPCGCLSFF